jgi:glycosyltransferase involved in cell wall biosynthesis
MVNRLLFRGGLGLWLRLFRFKREWLWTYSPLTTEFIDHSSYELCVYHCVDEIKAQPGMPVELLERAEEKLARSADVIFTTSPLLTESRRRWNSNTHYLSNVADYAHFNRALSAETTLPQDLLEIPSPRLGFIGAISRYKMNFELLREIAERRPDWSIVLVGEVGEGDPWTDSEVLRGLPNLHLLGPRPYNALPAYLKGMDVALLPNSINEYTDSMFPMKFFEYLASGRPVVSVALKALKDFGDVAFLSDSNSRFITNIERALAGEGAPLARRLEISREYTYEARTSRMLSIIGSLQ